jgi:hypothetical protein
MNTCILHKDQYKYIYRTSWLTLSSYTYAIYRGHYELSYTMGITLITSVNYWRKPDYSWRRYADMTCVKLTFLHHLIRAYYSQYSTIYYIMICSTGFLYPISIYFYKKKQYWYSTYSHCMLHIFVNISKMILYSGYIQM